MTRGIICLKFGFVSKELRCVATVANDFYAADNKVNSSPHFDTNLHSGRTSFLLKWRCQH